MEQDKEREEINYRFTFKDAEGKMGATVISIWERDSDLAIEAFEKLYPRIVWRRFECLDKPIQEQPEPDYELVSIGEETVKLSIPEQPCPCIDSSQIWIPLSEVKEFAKFLGKTGWEYSAKWDGFIDAFNFDSREIRTFEQLYQLFKQQNNR